MSLCPLGSESLEQVSVIESRVRRDGSFGEISVATRLASLIPHVPPLITTPGHRLAIVAANSLPPITRTPPSHCLMNHENWARAALRRSTTVIAQHPSHPASLRLSPPSPSLSRSSSLRLELSGSLYCDWGYCRYGRRGVVVDRRGRGDIRECD